MTEPAGQFDFQSVIRANRLERDNRRRAIDMPLHEVAADPAVSGQGAFEIHNAVSAKGPQVRAVESLLKQIESELMAPMCSDGKATAVDRHAVAFANFLGNPWRGNLQLCFTIRRPNPENRAEIFNQASKHLAILSVEAQPAKQEKWHGRQGPEANAR
jgi:hypothetical protein